MEHAVGVDWQLYESGPADGEHTVLLLPGGMCSARSYVELMRAPALAGLRLVAATLPGQAGTPAPEDVTAAGYGRVTAELVAEVGADVVVGFSMGANVALEMVEKRLFTGPVVLLGISLSLRDESPVLVTAIRLSRVVGTLPMRLMRTGAASMLRKVPVPAGRRAELAADFRRNDPREMRREMVEYLAWLTSGEDHAAMLCRSGAPAWVVHAEQGDGGLTDAERRTLDACPTVRVVTIPGSVFFLPNEVPDRVAGVIGEAVAALPA